MASVFDSHLDDFVLNWLRTPDSSYLEGADRAGTAPNPVVIAQGPHLVGGPSGAVGASEWSVVGVDIPAHAGIAWVLVMALPVFRWANAVDQPQMLHFIPLGEPTSALNYAYPVLTIPAAASAPVSNTGFLYSAVPTTTFQYQNTWIPLDPEHTEDGFSCVICSQAPAAGWGASDYRLDLFSVKYLGYPINAWNTGALQQNYARRGS